MQAAMVRMGGLLLLMLRATNGGEGEGGPGETNGRHGGLDKDGEAAAMRRHVLTMWVYPLSRPKGMLQRTAVAAPVMEPAGRSSSSRLRTRRSHR